MSERASPTEKEFRMRLRSSLEQIDEMSMLVAALLRVILAHQPQVKDELLAVINDYPARDAEMRRTRQRCRDIISGMATDAARKPGR